MNETITSILNHRSIRKYKEKPIEPEILELLLKTGIRAPSSGNLQNYSLMVVNDKKKMEILAKDAGAPFLTEAPLCIIALVDYYRFKRLCELNDAPFHYDTADSVFIGVWDAIVALHNIVVAAESIGLGTCYIGLVLETDNKRILGLPDYVFAAGMVSIGYPDNEPELRSRLPLEAIVHKNSYHIPSDDKVRQYYEDWMSKWDKFYAKLSEEQKKRWNEELGVYNNAQYITKTVYTKERITEWGKRIAENIRRAKFTI